MAGTHKEVRPTSAKGRDVLGSPPPAREIYLIGTAHVSLRSARDVRRVVEAVRPDNVVVELCASRWVVGNVSRKKRRGREGFLTKHKRGFSKTVLLPVPSSQHSLSWIQVAATMSSLEQSAECESARRFSILIFCCCSLNGAQWQVLSCWWQRNGWPIQNGLLPRRNHPAPLLLSTSRLVLPFPLPHRLLPGLRSCTSNNSSNSSSLTCLTEVRQLEGREKG